MFKTMTDLKKTGNLPDGLKILILEYGFRGLDIETQILFFSGEFGKFNKKFIDEIPNDVWEKYISLKGNLFSKLDSKLSEKIKKKIKNADEELNGVFIERRLDDKINWDFISKDQKLSVNFIRIFRNKINWDFISKDQKLSVNFIRTFRNNINYN